jgi:hypothetical protein
MEGVQDSWNEISLAGVNYFPALRRTSVGDLVMELYMKAAEANDSEAQHTVGLKYINGDGVPRDKDKGARVVDEGFEERELRREHGAWADGAGPIRQTVFLGF